MKTSLSEIKQIDDHIMDQLRDGDKLVFDARIIIDPVLRFNIKMHQKLYALAKAYGRRSMRKEISIVEENVFLDHSFREEIKTVFLKP
jgi:hypothetical protein